MLRPSHFSLQKAGRQFSRSSNCLARRPARLRICGPRIFAFDLMLYHHRGAAVSALNRKAPKATKCRPTLTSASSGETVHRLMDMQRGTTMASRLISAVAPVGASFALIVLSACTAMAADMIRPKRDLMSHAPYCVASEQADKGRLHLAMRRGPGEERSAPRMALVLGVAF